MTDEFGEPWTFEDSIVVGRGRNRIALVWTWSQPSQSLKTGMRIVTCVNECADLDPRQFKPLVGAVLTWWHQQQPSPLTPPPTFVRLAEAALATPPEPA